MGTDLKLYIADHDDEGVLVICANSREHLKEVVIEKLRTLGKLSPDGKTLTALGYEGDSLKVFLDYFVEHEVNEIVSVSGKFGYLGYLFSKP